MIRSSRLFPIIVGLLAVVTMRAHAQQPLPDFSGTWTIDAAKNRALQSTPPEATAGHARISTGTTPSKAGTGQIPASGVGPTSGAGDTFTIIQTGAAFTRQSPAPTPSGLLSSTYTLGTRQRVNVPGAREDSVHTNAFWSDNTVVIETARDDGPVPTVSRTTYAMDGNWLVVTTMTTGPVRAARGASPVRTAATPTVATTHTLYYKRADR